VTVPTDRVISGSRGQMVVLLGVLAKESQQRLDASYDGKPIPILGRSENTNLVAAMLAAVKPAAFHRFRLDIKRQEELFRKIAACDPAEAEVLWAEYQEWRDALISLEDASVRQIEAVEAFERTIRLMLSQYVLVAEVSADLAGRRLVMKYALDQHIETDDQANPKTIRRAQQRFQLTYAQEIRDLGFAVSHHVEVEVPVGLTVSSLSLHEYGSDDNRLEVQRAHSRLPGRIGHANLAASSVGAAGLVLATVSVSSQGIFLFTKLAVRGLAVAVVLGFLLRLFDDFLLREPTIPSPAASIILVGPALLISWISRQPEHPLVAQLVQPLRQILSVVALALVLMAGLAAVPVTAFVWNVVWASIVLAAAWSWVRLASFSLVRED
jgi:hypothetical protein